MRATPAGLCLLRVPKAPYTQRPPPNQFHAESPKAIPESPHHLWSPKLEIPSAPLPHNQQHP